MILTLLSYVGIVSGVVSLVLAIATVLYYISEQLEEHTVLAKRYITRYIYFVMGTYVLLFVFDRLPFLRISFSLFTNYMYLQAMSSFPDIDFRKPAVWGGLVCTAVTHLLWFYYFSDNTLPPHSIYHRIPHYDGPTLPPFSQVASFFGLQVWTVPLLLFLSLSANDQVLPYMADQPTNQPPARHGLAKQVLYNIWTWVLDVLRVVGVPVKTTEHGLPI